MPIDYVKPVIDELVRQLCSRPYPGHKRGCPNYGRRATCPPCAPLLSEFIDLQKPIIAVWVAFNLASHREKMKAKHPGWSRRQLDCCLYWQGSLNKRLRSWTERTLHAQALFGQGKLVATYCPEAMGVNVTQTMRNAGVVLEWPPETVVYKISLVGFQVQEEAE